MNSVFAYFLATDQNIKQVQIYTIFYHLRVKRGVILTTWSTFTFWDLLYISGTGKARDFKFGAQIDRQAYNPKNAKLGQKGYDLRHVTYFYNLGTSCISLE